jgi:hypothetical protein
VPLLRGFILQPDTPLDFDVKDLIVRQLDNAEDRFAVICHDDSTGLGQPVTAHITETRCGPLPRHPW